MIVVDASVIVAALLPSDPFHAVSRPWLEAYVSGGNRLVAPVLLMAEVAGAIARRTGNSTLGEQALRRVRRLPNMEWEAVDETLGEIIGRLAALGHLKGADATYVGVAAYRVVPLVTWDDEQRTRGGQYVTAYHP